MLAFSLKTDSNPLKLLNFLITLTSKEKTNFIEICTVSYNICVYVAVWLWDMITIIYQIGRVAIFPLIIVNEYQILLVTYYQFIYIHIITHFTTNKYAFSFLKYIMVFGSSWINKSLKINLCSKTLWSWKTAHYFIWK